MTGTLYLLPQPLGPDPHFLTLSPQAQQLLASLTVFAVENLKPARRLVVHARKHLQGVREVDLTGVEFLDIAQTADQYRALECLKAGTAVGILSDAGVPGIADPGAALVALAHAAALGVVPVAGPSAILLALMGSGLNGQQFCFHGYLPQQGAARKKALVTLQKQAQETGSTQVFIETPYRNTVLLRDALAVLAPTTRLCIAADLTLQSAVHRTLPVSQWRNQPLPDLHKRPAVFCIGR